MLSMRLYIKQIGSVSKIHKNHTDDKIPCVGTWGEVGS